MNEKFLKPFEPKEVEESIYKKWEDSGFFNPDICIEKGIASEKSDTFSIVLPPPNVTGTLHTGHAFMLVIEDIIVRYHRMNGKKTLWIPGTDHAAIATQTKVEKILDKKGVKKHDIGRQKFLEEVEKFAQESHDTIVSQIKKMGASLDWSREAYTLDEKREVAVRTAFKRMYDDGLIYRGYRIVNWDPKGQTTISDDEVIHEKTKGKLYTFRYSKDFPIPIATTRPETKIGDTAVAVHPDDLRYKEYIGKTFNVEFAGVALKIKIVGDKEVDPEFGTGAVGVTPAHSMTDWDIAERHKLPVKQVIDEYAKIIVGPNNLKGKRTREAREIILSWIKENNLLEKEEEIEQNISKAERSRGIVEPLPKKQWFIDVNKKFTIHNSNIKGIKSGSETTLKELMLSSVESGQINILPERFEKQYFHWVRNLRDWCISRQIWFGHRIPVWYKEEEIYVGIEEPEGEGWWQDPDTLDTWFSSGLWTFSTLGWPEETKDLKTYHPTSVLETGYDILPFWVSRMILMTTYLLGEIPFETAYFHGLVRDSKGRKMSKSLGNIVDPVDLIDKYGADALRMALIVGTGPGQDSNLDENKVNGYKKFSNKLWNITRFILSNTEGAPEERPELNDSDKKLVEELNGIVIDITDDINNFRFHLASEKLYQYTWHRLADEIIEDSKDKMNDSRKWTLLHILATIIKALHPFIPFVTEEIWESLPIKKEQEMLMVTKWPEHSH